jgi:hypothetical protein
VSPLQVVGQVGAVCEVAELHTRGAMLPAQACCRPLHPESSSTVELAHTLLVHVAVRRVPWHVVAEVESLHSEARAYEAGQSAAWLQQSPPAQHSVPSQ